MRHRIAILFALVLPACCNAGAESMTVSTKLHTRFVERGVLSPVEVSNVVALAKQCGLSEAVSVRTYYFMPISADWNFGIEVKGAEVVSGRRISYMTVDIYRHPLQPEYVLKSHGHLWISRGSVRTNEFTSFVVSNRTIRVEMPSTLSLATADKILGAFASGKVEFRDSDPFLKQAIKDYDFSAPSQLTGPRDDGRYTARVGTDHGCEIEFTLVGDVVRVVSVSFFMT